MTERFDLADFLPYTLNQAAERASRGFQSIYKERYGMLRTEWRVLFHLGRHGKMTAKEICDRSGLHKTKVSRAVKALEERRFLTRVRVEEDRRMEVLALTKAGAAAYADLSKEAVAYEAVLTEALSEEDLAALRRSLSKLMAI